ncbi:hypothetical protein A5730_03185 [Mycobacterium sp. ACS4054]|nr:hypothetical protein [Mycobacterium sp. ACS4054]OBF12569.1 hypothetical protein A5730_03185 [Mycobacterium sp. ACS4054]
MHECEASRPVIVAISARWKVRPGKFSETAASTIKGAADVTSEMLVVQAGGTDNGPSGTASPTPADGAPTADEGWNGHTTRYSALATCPAYR